MKPVIFVPWLWVGLISLLGCDGASRSGGIPLGARVPIHSEQASFYIDTLYTKLENPWGMVWLPDGVLLITERKGEIIAIDPNGKHDKSLQGFPETYAHGQGGLMDIQLHPQYAKNGWIYSTYAKPTTGGGSTVLIRFQLNGHRITNLETLFETTPVSTSKVHFGSRIAFDNAGYLYLGTGERGTQSNAQDLTNDLGKVHRLHDDGRIPADNPFASDPNAKPSIWSYGHRNIQGLAYDSANHILYATEHGPRGGDELNVIEKGRNYGWPIITYGIDYSGAIISEHVEMDGMEQPIHYWTPSIATCGLLYYTGTRYPGWNGNLFMGALALTHVARVELSSGRYIHEERLLEGVGRVRQVAQSPDGYIFVLTEGPGMLLKLVPVQGF